MGWLRALSLAILGRYGRRLRFPQLLLLTGLLLILDLVVPDLVPFLDELLLAGLTLLFASWREGEAPPEEEAERGASGDGESESRARRGPVPGGDRVD